MNSTLLTRRDIALLVMAGLGLIALIGNRYYARVITETPRATPCPTAEERSARAHCWTERLEAALRTDGTSGAFGALAALYVSDPDVSQSCHALTHRIGQAAYERFAAGKNFEVTPQVAFCNFGFYHGFMEALLRATNDPAEARTFCDFIDAKLGALTADAAPQCYHGIGHGTIGSHEPQRWGNEEALIRPSLELCERIAATADQLYRCASGVYNGLSDFYLKSEYGLSMDRIDPADPLRICRQQPAAYREACYGNFKGVLARLTKRNFPKIAAIIERIPNEADAASTIWYFAAFNIEQKLNAADHSPDIAICRRLRPALHRPCIQGLGTGFLWYGTPGTEYREAIAFCRTPLLSLEEREACFRKVLKLLPDAYPASKVQEICSTIELPYRALCPT